MCELMALSAAGPVHPSALLRAFAARDEQNADGWGLAWYDGPALCLVKEPIRWRASRLAGLLMDYDRIRSNLLIAHIREGTTGGAANLADTHPFVRELAGREYAFAHNGTLAASEDEPPLGRWRPVGGTDSERYFCRLLDDLDRSEVSLDDIEGWRWVHEHLESANRRGSLNGVVSDGRTLVVHHDSGGWKGLWHRTGPDPSPAPDPDHEGPVAVVATRPIGGDGWTPFRHGETIVFQDGAVVWSSEAAEADIDPRRAAG